LHIKLQDRLFQNVFPSRDPRRITIVVATNRMNSLCDLPSDG
jgi:hypothetical protein